MASAGERVVRGGLIIAILGLAVVSLRASLGLWLREAAPSLALAVSPWDARIVGLNAESVLTRSQDARAKAEATALSARALKRDATVVSAVSTAGLVAALNGKAQQALHLFQDSEQLSRRDLKTQVWLVENAVARNDIRGALHHYDVALRTSREAPAMMYPVLGAAISDVDIRREAVMVLMRRPAWADSFLSHVALHGPDFGAAALLMTMLQQKGYHFENGTQKALVSNLVKSGGYREGWAYFSKAFGIADPMATGVLANSRDTTTSTPFEWSVDNMNGVSAYVQQSPLIGFDAPAGAGGVVAKRTFVLPAGRYVFAGRAEIESAAHETMPYWDISCADGRRLARASIVQNGNGAQFATVFEVNGDCVAETITLMVSALENTQGLSGTITSAKLSRR